MLGLLAASVLLAEAASGSVTTIAYYRLGEDDPGAADGSPGNSETPDHYLNAPNLKLGGAAPTYSSATGVSGSSLCVAMNGGGYIDSTSFSVGANWGIEAWVNPDVAAPPGGGAACITYKGDSQYNGMGLYQLPDGTFTGLCGNAGFAGSSTVVPGVWTHLALVYTAGATTFYVNGAAVGTGPAPHPPSGPFGIGANSAGKFNGEYFQGRIDEMRAFTFLPGLFSTNLLLTSAPPAPVSSLVLSAGHEFVTWSGERLQTATGGLGPWITITNAPSPYIAPADGASRFFRAQATPTLSPAGSSGLWLDAAIAPAGQHCALVSVRPGCHPCRLAGRGSVMMRSDSTAASTAAPAGQCFFNVRSLSLIENCPASR